jgi:hypothetical protein
MSIKVLLGALLAAPSQLLTAAFGGFVSAGAQLTCSSGLNHSHLARLQPSGPGDDLYKLSVGLGLKSSHQNERVPRLASSSSAKPFCHLRIEPRYSNHPLFIDADRISYQ